MNEISQQKQGINSKRIMFFAHPGESDYITGAEKNLLLMLNELGKKHQCILVSPSESCLCYEVRNKGMEVIIVSYPMCWSMWNPNQKLLKQKQSLVSKRVLDKLVKILEDRKPDLVFVNSCINMLPPIAANKVGIPVAWWIQEVISTNNHTHLTVKIIDQYSDWILGLSQAALKPFLKKGIDKKSLLVYPGLDVNQLKPSSWEQHRDSMRKRLGLKQGEKLIAFISAYNHPNKGLDHFIKMAIRIIKKCPETHYLIVGNKHTSPEYYSSCMKLIDESNYKNHFHFVSFEPQIQKIFPPIDILVVPSFTEGFGLVCLEGLVFGKAVVAYRSGGLSEILSCTGNEEFLVETGNIAELEIKVEKLVNDKALLKQISDSNQALALKAFGLDSFRERVGAFIEQVTVKQKNKDFQPYTPLRGKFPDGVLLKGTAPTVFLVENGMKRPFANEKSLKYFKFSWRDVIIVNDNELNRYPTGFPIDCRKRLSKYNPKKIK